jgi:hypothetical protein
MPLLNDSDRDMMRRFQLPCARCRAVLRKHYCRQCDEFFLVGHTEECSWEIESHEGHRVDTGTGTESTLKGL